MAPASAVATIGLAGHDSGLPGVDLCLIAQC